jgi:phosphonate transport system ATP-binding protein
VARDTVRRVRALVAEVDLHAPPVGHRSLLWNTLVAGRPWWRALGGLLRLPRASERRVALHALERVGLGGRPTEPAGALGAPELARLAVAGALVRRPECLVIREVDSGLDAPAADVLRGLVRALARSERVVLVASAGSPSFALDFADRIVALADGLLVFDGPPAGFLHPKVVERFRTA